MSVEVENAVQRRAIAEAEALFLSIGEGAVVTDNSGNISRINAVALETIGYSQKEVIGKWYPSIFIAIDNNGATVANVDRPIYEVFLSGKPVFRRMNYLRKDKTIIKAAVTVSPIIVNGTPIGAIEVFRDITSEVVLENAKDEFISIASHELRTPATIVKQYLNMVMGGYAGILTDDQMVMLATANENNERQLTIINDLLRVARAEADKINLEKQNVELIRLVDEVINEQYDKFNDAHQSLEFIHADKTVSLIADPVHVKMIFENILSNANKYTSNGGIITVTVTTTKNKIKVAIQDTGVGIRPGDLSKLFVKFSRIDNPLTTTAGGSGLGLYWVKKLVILHDASIHVSSKIGKGTTFTVAFTR